jgi:hypothetical protein
MRYAHALAFAGVLLTHALARRGESGARARLASRVVERGSLVPVSTSVSQEEWYSLLHRFLEQMVQVSSFLMRSEKSDRNFAAGANLAFEAFANFSQGKVAAQIRPQSREA